MKENVVQINGEITVNVDVSVKSAIYVKKIIFGILLHVVRKMENIWQLDSNPNHLVRSIIWSVYEQCLFTN